MKTLQTWMGTLILALGAIAPGRSAEWPTHPIKLVVPYTAGGQFDIVARMLAEKMGASLGQPVVVENKPGNNTLIGADYVAKSGNDGYTLLYAGANMFSIAPHLYSRMPFKRSDFQTVSLVSELPMGLIVNGKLPVRTLAEFVDYVKAHPGKLSFGTSGEGGAQHLLCDRRAAHTGRLERPAPGRPSRHSDVRGTGRARRHRRIVGRHRRARRLAARRLCRPAQGRGGRRRGPASSGKNRFQCRGAQDHHTRGIRPRHPGRFGQVAECHQAPWAQIRLTAPHKDTRMTDWNIWGFCYALGRLPHDFLSGAPVASNRGTVEVPMMISLLKSSRGQLVLVDTGFDSGASMTGRRFDDFVRSDVLLERFGVDPRKIETLVLTHMHFDHAGNLRGFPNARIYVQRYEYESWKRVIEEFGEQTSKSHWAFSSLNVADFHALEAAARDGRVVFLDGAAAVAEGVTCRLAKDTHTFGSQWREVATPDGAYVIAGDCCYTYENLERMWPPGYMQGNAWNMLREFRRMKDVAGDDLRRLVPGHDIALFDRHPGGRREETRFIEVHLAKGGASFLE